MRPASRPSTRDSTRSSSTSGWARWPTSATAWSRGSPTWPAAVGADDGDRGRRAAAARLAKADQGAVLVAEFSELQGYVAAEYARLEGIDEAVALAVERAVPARRARLADAATEAGGAARGDREGRQPGRRLRGRRGPHRLEGPVRPAPGRRRAGADRARARLGRLTRDLLAGATGAWRPRAPTCVLDDASALRPAGGVRGRPPGLPPRGEGVAAEAAAAATGAGLGGVAGDRRLGARGRGGARRRCLLGGLDRGHAAAARIAAQGARRRRAPPPGDDPGEAALRDGRARPRARGSSAAREARDSAAGARAAAGSRRRRRVLHGRAGQRR